MTPIKSIAAAALLLLLSFACLAQDKTTGAIKGKVRVEKGSPADVAVILRQGEREVTRTATDKKGDFVIARIVPGVRVELARIVGESSTQKIDFRITGETGEFVFRLPPDAAKYRLTLKADGVEPVSQDVAVESAA